MWFQCVRYKTHILKNTEKSKLSIILLLREDYFSVLEYVLLNFFSLYLKNIFMAKSSILAPFQPFPQVIVLNCLEFKIHSCLQIHKVPHWSFQ